MIARLHVAVPFNMAVPQGVEFKLYTYEDDGYSVTVFPPTQTDELMTGTVPKSVGIDGGPGFVANGLTIELHKETFDRRRNAPSDPPEPLMIRAVNSFLARLRYVTRGQMVQLVSTSTLPGPWQLRYLNDDESELDDVPELFRGTGRLRVRWSHVGINASTWEQIHSLPPDFKAPVWDDLRLDAVAALPSLGTAMVLAFASLETFIAQTLDALAPKSALPAELWKWINDRGHFLKEPTTEEQFDVLLHLFTGHSLKEDGALWESFKNLKDARNAFVHEGVATIGKGKKPVTEVEAAQLVGRVDQIIKWVRQWLPDEVKMARICAEHHRRDDAHVGQTGS
jgi:hypothetical protein